MSKPFFFRIDLIELMDFATEPAGAQMSLLQFAKELKSGESDHPAIQQIIDEAHNYIEKKKKAGSSGGKARVINAQAKASNGQAVLKQNQADLKPEAVTETVTEQKNKTFMPPSVEEVTQYCLERNNNVDPEGFVNHYQARGWIPKGYTKQMKDWKAAVRTWEKNAFNTQRQQPQQQLYN